MNPLSMYSGSWSSVPDFFGKYYVVLLTNRSGQALFSVCSNRSNLSY